MTGGRLPEKELMLIVSKIVMEAKKGTRLTRMGGLGWIRKYKVKEST